MPPATEKHSLHVEKRNIIIVIEKSISALATVSTTR